MVAVKKLLSVVAVFFAFVLLAPHRPADAATDEHGSPAASLFAQSAAEVLRRDFSDPDISFLMLDARTDQVLASSWDSPELPIPLGSLAKPFTALAYGQQHEFRYPTHVCRGTASGCWRPGGHGAIDLAGAIAYSCNSYFSILTKDLDSEDISITAGRFRIDPPDPETKGTALAGAGSSWRVAPLRMARAYLELARQGDLPAVQQILEGMAKSARQGTGAEVGRALPDSRALVKTGTAPCTHARRTPGEGFAIAMLPADDPRILLMVRVHGVPGSQAAKTAGQMLRRIQD